MASDKDHDYGKDDDRGYGKGSEQKNESKVEQGDDEATGGNSQATGGNGGDADTGNKQFLNGNSLALSLSDGFNGPVGILPFPPRGGGVESEGGDTYAKSGDAYGGDGGDAKSSGGDADASERVKVTQLNGGGGSF